MSLLNPNSLHPASPNELMLFLDSVRTSSLCPHTKDWVCFLYVSLHQELCQFLDFSMHVISGNDLFMIRYGGREGKVPFCIKDLVAYLEDLPRPQYEMVRQFEARRSRQIFSAEWDLAADNIVWRIPLPIRIERPNVGSHLSLEHRNPAVWFALKGKYTIANFLADRSLSKFIEDHWMRLLFQFGNARTGKWEHHDALDRCRCPGYALTHLLAFGEPNKIADAVLKEILTHVDPLIVEHLRPYIEGFEEERRRVSVHGLENWYQPLGSTQKWNHVARFPALEAVSNRLLIAFEDLQKAKAFRILAEAWM